MKKDDECKVFESVEDMFDELDKSTTWEKITLPFWRVWYFIKDIPYRFRARFIYQHHLVKFPRLSKWGWCDTDCRLLHANMELLTQFIDNECPFEGHIDWNYDEGHKNAEREMREIYDWWKSYPMREKEIDEAIDRWFNADKKDQEELHKVLNRLKESLYNEEKIMLHKVIDIKDFFWT